MVIDCKHLAGDIRALPHGVWWCGRCGAVQRGEGERWTVPAWGEAGGPSGVPARPNTDAAEAFFAAWGLEVTPLGGSLSEYAARRNDAIQALAQALADERNEASAAADIAELLVLLSAEKFRAEGLLRELERSQALLRRSVGVVSDVVRACGAEAASVLDAFVGVVGPCATRNGYGVRCVLSADHVLVGRSPGGRLVVPHEYVSASPSGSEAT